MQHKLVTQFSDLNSSDVVGLAESIRVDTYQIVTTRPEADNAPHGILSDFTSQKVYQYILDDDQATFEYFSFRYKTEDASILMPMGVYGRSDLYRIYFPLQLNSFGRAFVMMSFDDFCAIYGHDPDAKTVFGRLLTLRERFISRIFDYYYNLSDDFNSVMAWQARSPKSPTRRIAEAVHFIRREIGEEGSRSEVYSRRDLTGGEFRFLVECGSRWDNVFNEAQRKNVDVPGSAENDISEKVTKFYRNLMLPL